MSESTSAPHLLPSYEMHKLLKYILNLVTLKPSLLKSVKMANLNFFINGTSVLLLLAVLCCSSSRVG